MSPSRARFTAGIQGTHRHQSSSGYCEFPFVNREGKDVNSDWLTDQWDERSVLGHARFHKGRMNGDDPEVDTARTSRHFDGRLALLEKIRKTFTESVPNKVSTEMK